MQFSKTNPFFGTLKERTLLNKSGSPKNTYHLVVDIKDSGITYAVGDSLGVLPCNDPVIVTKTIEAMGFTGNESLFDKRSEQTFRLYDYLKTKANLANVTKALIKLLAEKQIDSSKEELNILLAGSKEALEKYIESHYVWDLLLKHKGVSIPLEQWPSLLMPLLPRFYSISSSMHAVGNEIHLTIAHLSYTSNNIVRHGTCTDYLCRRIKVGDSLPIFLQPSHGFGLPEDHQIPLIMVGPGTGVAPFRAFLQERVAKNASGGHWLFFGERKRHTDFLYEDYWNSLVAEGKLRIETAFSRDQEHKIYVQHRLIEHGNEIWRWLQKGALFCVCGDATRMAKDVDATLHRIVQEHGQFDETGARQYIKQLRADKRYLRDVY